jgi:DNA-binding NarL/FixJ family response regulator
MKHQPRVLIAHEQPPMRAALRESLEGGGFTVVAEVADAPRAIESALARIPHLCLLDVRLPGGAVRVAREITACLPDTDVVAIGTGDGSELDLLDVLRAGAAGCLPVDRDLSSLPVALRAVLGGEAALPRRLVGLLIEELRSHDRRPSLNCPRGRRVALTAREWDVIALMHEGLSTAETAERLVVSPVTVRRHVSTAVRKLGVPDREAAVRLLDGRL